MLTVVGIIAVLVATSIPMVNNSLDKAKHSTDAANERAAKAAAVVGYLQDTVKVGTIYSYDAAAGQLVSTKEDKEAVTAYGKHNHDNMVIDVTIIGNGDVSMNWRTAGTGTSTNTELCSMSESVTHSTSTPSPTPGLSLPTMPNDAAAHTADKDMEVAAKEAAKAYYNAQGSSYRYQMYKYFPNETEKIQCVTNSPSPYGRHGSHKDMFIEVDIISEDEIYVYWESATVSNFEICSVAGSTVEHSGPAVGNAHATDAAIEDAAYMAYANGGWIKGKYNLATGEIVPYTTAIAAYGQHADHAGMWVEIDQDSGAVCWRNDSKRSDVLCQSNH